jgi:hypothetical protein
MIMIVRNNKDDYNDNADHDDDDREDKKYEWLLYWWV